MNIINSEKETIINKIFNKINNPATYNDIVEFEELSSRIISEENSSGLCEDSLHIWMKPKKIKTTSPVCLICVVDVSGSMGYNCCNNVSNMESQYISRLELVKHSLKTIVSSLRKGDMFGVVTFEFSSKVLIKPTKIVGKKTKDDIIKNIDKMIDGGGTDMWTGIEEAINISESISYQKYQKSLMVFTDGETSDKTEKGIYETLKDKIESSNDKFTISTFSFGNDVGPELLIKIANLGNGIYGYCSDGTMVGTIFINYMANLLSTITPVVKINVCQGNDINKTMTIGPLYRALYRNAIIQIDKKLLNETKVTIELPMINQTIEVPIIQESPNIPLFINEMSENNKQQNAFKIKDNNNNNNNHDSDDDDDENDDDDDDDDEILDSDSDSEIDEKIENIENIDTDIIIEEKDTEPVPYEERLLNELLRNKFIITLNKIIKLDNIVYKEKDNQKAKEILEEYIQLLKDLKYKTKYAKDLLIDISNPDPNHGQVEKAIKKEYYDTWGECYINSFLRFHQYEQCGNFKDQSLQYYAHEIFNTYRKMANTIFVNLPPPSSNDDSCFSDRNGQGQGSTVQMRNFIDRHGGCFNGEAIVLMSNGQNKYVKDLKKGDILNNGAIVKCLIEQNCDSNGLFKPYMCDINGVLLTPYHPVCVNNQWSFPIDIIQPKPVNIQSWFNLVLEDSLNQKYEVEFNSGIKAITLGHYRTENSVLKHPYFGSDLVLKDLEERDPEGYSNGYIYIQKVDVRNLQYDENQCCINYYKIQSNTNTFKNNCKIIKENSFNPINIKC